MKEEKKAEGIVLGAFSLPKRETETGHDIFVEFGKAIAERSSEFISSYIASVSTNDKTTPAELGIEFGVKLGIQGGIVKIFSADLDADIKVKIAWKDIPRGKH